MNILFIVLILMISSAFAKPELRCGWWWSTPGETSISDRDGSWTIRQQGGYEAKELKGASIEIKDHSLKYYQPIQGSQARACVCLKADFDPKTHRAQNLAKLTQKKIVDCEKKVKPIFPADFILAGQTVPESADEAVLRVTLSQSELYVEGLGVFGLEYVKKIGDGYLCKTDSVEADQKFLLVSKAKGKLTVAFRASEATKSSDWYEVAVP